MASVHNDLLKAKMVSLITIIDNGCTYGQGIKIL